MTNKPEFTSEKWLCRGLRASQDGSESARQYERLDDAGKPDGRVLEYNAAAAKHAAGAVYEVQVLRDGDKTSAQLKQAKLLEWEYQDKDVVLECRMLDAGARDLVHQHKLGKKYDQAFRTELTRRLGGLMDVYARANSAERRAMEAVLLDHLRRYAVEETIRRRTSKS